MKTAIDIDKVVVTFGHTRAVDDVSLAIKEKRCFGLVGESGSGKTTLMRAALGLQRLTSGAIKLFGESSSRGAQAMRRRSRIIQAIFQDPAASLSPRRTVGSLMDEVGEVLGEGRDETRERMKVLFSRIGLNAATADKYPYQLSGGQARRVAVARALLMKPKVLIADEPTAGLDVSVQGDLLNLLQELRRDFELTLVVVSHNLAVIRLITDDAAIMLRGKVIERGKAAQVLESPESDYGRKLLDSWPRLHVAGMIDTHP